MRIVTRPDFDGIVCAVLLMEAEPDLRQIIWMEPNDIQSGRAEIKTGDVLANLPCHPNATLWFDHHVSNQPPDPVPGAFAIAPSAAGVVYRYFQDKGKLDRRFDELVAATDMIDSASLTREQVNAPEEDPYVILSMTVKNDGFKDIPYWNRLVEMLRTEPVQKVLQDPEVDARCQEVVEENREFIQHLKAHTQIRGQISVTDFRGLDPVPSGNRFLTYALFPDTVASIRIRYKDKGHKQVLLSIGHSIFNRQCKVNVGHLLARYGGGGHAGAGGCTLDTATAQACIDEILEKLVANREVDAP